MITFVLKIAVFLETHEHIISKFLQLALIVWQIFPNGFFLQTYSPNGVLFEQFSSWCCLLRGLHVKCMQNASSNCDFVGIGHMETQPASAVGNFTWKLVPPTEAMEIAHINGDLHLLRPLYTCSVFIKLTISVLRVSVRS